MIEITYDDGTVIVFEIYNDSDNHISWKDYADNLIRINKKTNRVTMFHINTWIQYDSHIVKYRRI